MAGLSVSMMMTVIVPILPELPGLLGVSSEAASWLITITLLMSVVATPSISRLADMVGKKRMMLFSLSAMVVGSLIGVFGSTYPSLLLARGLQGLAIALTPVAMSVMRDELPRERLSVSIAVMSATQGVGAGLGLPLSGVLYQAFGWNAVFWLSSILGIVMLILVIFVIPESPVRTGGRFDVLGALLLGGGLACLLVGITRGGAWGWTSPATFGMFGLSVVLFAMWVPWELRVSQPLVDVRTMSRRPVMLTNAASVAAGFALYTNLLATTELLELPAESGFGFDLPAILAGLAMLPAALSMVVFAPLSSIVTNRYGPQRTLLIGFLALLGGYLGRVFFIDSVTHVIVGALVIGFGIAFTFAAQPVIIMRSVPVTETASANGLNIVLRSMGTSTASAAVAAELSGAVVVVGAQVYPSPFAFQLSFILASVAASIGVVCAAALRPIPVDAQPHDPVGEFVARGRLVGPGNVGIEHATVSILSADRQTIDWSHTDEHGDFSIVLPKPGHYDVHIAMSGHEVDESGIDFGQQSVTELTVP